MYILFERNVILINIIQGLNILIAIWIFAFF